MIRRSSRAALFAWLSLGTLSAMVACDPTTGGSAVDRDGGGADGGTNRRADADESDAWLADDAPSGDATGEGGDADTDAGGLPVQIRFEAKVFDAPCRCGQAIGGIGTPPREATLVDFRFYLHDVRLVDDDGNEVPVALRQDRLWQHQGVALIDFENGQGSCSDGDAIENALVEGRVPEGHTYRGLKFRLGVPASLNHSDLSTQPPPLDKNSLFWAWQSGHIFFAGVVRARIPIDGGTGEDAGTFAYSHYTHMGATGCNGSPAIGIPVTACDKPNRPEFSFPDFDPDVNVVVADLGELKKGTDLGGEPCHAETAVCAPAFANLGVDWATGNYDAIQTTFRME